MLRHKKLICSILAVVQASYPVMASASTYFYKTPIKEVKAGNGKPLPVTNVDPKNTSSVTTRAGEAVLRVSPSVVEFGTIPTTKSSVVQTITLYNLGGKSLTLGALSASSQFSVSDNCDGIVVPPLGNCQVNVTFAPTEITSSAQVTGKLAIPFSSAGHNAITNVDLSGTPAAPPAGAVKDAVLDGLSDLQADGSMQFPLAIINQQSWPKSFKIRSSGDSPLEFRGLSFLNNDGSFTASSDCPASIPVGTECTVTAVFAPQTIGSKRATLVLGTNSYRGNNLPVALAGEAIEVYPVYGGASTSTVAFGDLVQGGTTASRTVTINNSGTAPLSIGQVTLTGSSLAGLTLGASTCDKPVAPEGSCSVTLNYAPTATGTLNAKLVVPHNGRLTPTSPVNIPITGSVVAQTRVLSYPTNVDFGTVDAGVATTKAMTITNTGNSPISNISVSTSSPFSVSTNTCLNQTLQPAGTCTVTFSLTSSTNGAASRLATISATGLTTSAPAVVVQGTIQTRSIAALAPTSVAFGLQSSTAWSTDERTFTVTNTGNVTLKPAVVGRLADNTLSSAPWIRVSSDTCSNGVAPNASCVIGLQVKPTSATALSTSVSVAPDASMSTGSRALTVTATGTPQSYAVSASDLNFGTVGSLQYVERTFTVTNTSPAGTSVTGFSGVTFTQPTPANSGTLSLQASTCSSTIASQASCTMTIRLTAPSYASTDAVALTGGNVNFYWSGARSTWTTLPVTASLVGSNLTAAASGSDFGDIPAGVTAASAKRFTITVNNTGAYPVTLSSGVIDSTNSLALTEDTAASNRCVSGTNLAAGASCVHVVYSSVAANNGGGVKTSSFTPRSTSQGQVRNVGTALPFTGNVVAPTVSTSTELVDFGVVGEKTTVTKTFTFQPSHGGSVQYASTSTTGTGFSSSVVSCPNPLTTGNTCTVTVSFSPNTFTTEDMAGSIGVNFNVNGVSKTLATVAVKAKVEKGTYAVDYNDLNWGNAPSQTAGQLRYAVLRNTSANAVLPLGTRTVAAPFSVSTATSTFTYNGNAVVNCSTLTQLNPSQSCYLGVTLSGATGTYAGSGAYAGNAVIQSSAAAANLTVPMTANFLVADPQMGNSVTFANPTPSTTTHNPDMTLTLTNNGGGRMYWTTATGGSKAFYTTGNFWLVSTSGGASQSLSGGTVANAARCEEASHLDPGASCYLTLRFTPTGAAEVKSGALKVGVLSPNATTLTANLSGTAQAGVMFLNQSSLDFGQQLVGSSTTQTILIGNGGNGPMNISGITRLRADAAAAAYPTELTATHNCPATLPAGESCLINVTFAPDRNLNFGTLSSKEIVRFYHYTNGAWATTDIPLSGIGNGSQLTVDQQSHNLGAVDTAVVGYDYNRTVTFRASGPAPVRITSVTAPRTHAFLETRAGGTCVSNMTLQPGETCSLMLRNRSDFSTYTAGTNYVNYVQDVFTINGSFYKDNGTMQSDRSVQLLASATMVTQATVAEVTPRIASTKKATPASVFGTGFRAGAKVFVDEIEQSATTASATEVRFTIPSGLTTGTHTVRVVNTDGLSLSKSLTFTVSADDVNDDQTQDVRTVGYDRPYSNGGGMHATALPDGRLVHVTSGGSVLLMDATGRLVASASTSYNNPLATIKASASGNQVTVAWISTYANAFCYNPGYYGCRGERIYHETAIILNMQTFTVSGSTLTAGTRYSSNIFYQKDGPEAPVFGIEAFDISRSGSQTLVAYSTTVFGTRSKGVQVWNGSTTPGPAYNLPVQSGSINAMGALLRGNVAFVRWGDRIYAYDVAGTTLSGGASYQYADSLGSDTASGLSMSSYGEVLTSCYSNRAICAIASGGAALGTAGLLTGNPAGGGYVDGTYDQARFNLKYVGAHPEGVLAVQSSTPNASRVVKR